MLGEFMTNRKVKAKLNALDALRANIMLADPDLNIMYMNPAVAELLRDAEADLKKELPRFSVDTLIGSNIDVFHKNPSHQRNMLATLSKRHNATIWVGNRAFDLLVTPLMNGNKRIGFVVEWADAKARMQNLDYTAQIAAISRSQAMIEFKVDGTIVTANQNFLSTLGYSLSEIQGRHHSIFIEKSFSESQAYTEFWKALSRGEFQAAEFKRVHKDGRIVTIQASYNPILDEKGTVTKVVKFATDVSKRVHTVNEIGDALKRLAGGDLSFQLNEPFTPDFEPLRHDLNGAISQLGDTLRAVAEATGQIDTGIREISQSAEDLSKRTEQQASSLEQTAAALDQITANVGSSSKRAEEARSVALHANESAVQSGKVVANAVDAMQKIEQSSNQVSNIIGVIDEIAFQTNLLALNAGVEAARAGEAGKGFAVVAQEVRELAQRSAQAAKEIKELIRNSSVEVQSGVKLVSDTGDSLKTIETYIITVNQHMEAIATSTREQSVGLSEVNTAVNQMDQVTQQNAAMVEETNAASATLASEAGRLRELISRFQLGGALRHKSAAMAATSGHRPVASPARRMAGQVAKAFAGNAAPSESWEEF